MSALAKAVRLVSRPRPIITRLTRFHAAALRASRGRVRRSVLFAGGQPVLSLHTVGRHSGRPRSTVVAYLKRDDDYVVFGANLGSTKDPAWCLNLGARPDAAIHVDGRRMAVRARRARGEEAERLWAAYAERMPLVERFRDIAERDIPIMVLEPVGDQAVRPPSTDSTAPVT